MTHAARTHTRRGFTHGFTLVEVMVTLPLVALLMIGAFNLFLMSLQLGSKTAAQLVATQDAANAIQQVVEVGREAYTITLLGTGTPSAATLAAEQGAGFSDSQFQSTLSGQAIYTGLYVTMPATLAPADVGYTQSLNYITVVGGTGHGTFPATQTAPMPSAPYTCTPTTAEAGTEAQFLIYRADSNGTPDPAAGGYLWEQPLPVSTSSPGFPLCRTVATGAPNAVQFVQPGTNQLEVKIVSGVYSAINGVQTDEEGNGTFSSQVDGKCVLMRNHNPITNNPPGGTTTPFRAH